jgi:hypothetical protein
MFLTNWLRPWTTKSCSFLERTHQNTIPPFTTTHSKPWMPLYTITSTVVTPQYPYIHTLNIIWTHTQLVQNVPKIKKWTTQSVNILIRHYRTPQKIYINY